MAIGFPIGAKGYTIVGAGVHEKTSHTCVSAWEIRSRSHPKAQPESLTSCAPGLG